MTDKPRYEYTAKRAELEQAVRDAKAELRNFLDTPALHALRNLALRDGRQGQTWTLGDLYQRYGIADNEPTIAGKDRLSEHGKVLQEVLSAREDELIAYLRNSVGGITGVGPDFPFDEKYSKAKL